MSIVERALKRLQQSGQMPPGAKAPDRRSAPAPAPSSAAREPVPARGRQLGDPAKTLHVDFDGLRRAGLLPPEHQQRELAHQYRILKRPILKCAFGADPPPPETRQGSLRALMVTSALPGEGKTFTAINLALSLALEKDRSVILIDGDAPKPHISKAFGLGGEPGLLDLLARPEMPVEPAVRPTDVPSLYLLPVGNRSDTATELLSSTRMRQVLEELQRLDENGIVLLDAPPILLTSEAQVLASLFGQLVLVVRSGTTPQQAVTDALGIIGEGPRIGLVLNQALHDDAGGYYGYGYGDGFRESMQTEKQ